MSLGIAVIENSNVFLMADTQMSFDVKDGKKPYFGLKVFFLDKNIAIAYSGTAGQTAHGRLYGIYKQGHRNDLNILAEQICSSFDQKVDFLLAKTGIEPSIAKITGGSFSFQTGKGIYWIGDGDAARFVADTKINTANQLQEGLSNTIEDSRFTTVGGYSVIAQGKIDGFRFSQYTKLVSPRYTMSGVGWKVIDFGTAQTGGFGYTTVVPIEAGINGWGVFYFHGCFGEYWHVDLDANVCEILKAHARNVTDFIKLITYETGIELEACGSFG